MWLDRNVFLFIAPVTLNRCPESGSTEVRWLTNGRDHYFWSFDPSGSTPLSRRTCNNLGLPKYKTSISSMVHNLFDYQYAAAKYLQEIQGFDPLTQDFAQTHGLPLVEILSPSKHFHPNVVNLTEEDQEELYTWYDAEETLSDKSDSESVYEEASSQIQNDSDLGSFEGDFYLDEESDDSASKAFGLNLFSGSVSDTGCKPSSWLDAYTFRWICSECLRMDDRHQQPIEEWDRGCKCRRCYGYSPSKSYIRLRKRPAST
ncbi:hypothetical protein K435DRAFT_869105 [Dendrothele bispora CBS 962.96]|uniref:Uncharacterized protein n=1 Tax=Dendrothele bispora (strain CBS 962.96) TaxID=1314807 RepID=A0A4S8LBB9_DENBC|nr:hypothetical protein K435DRAFT_869105 [Dendrothele bispora CBS 962.96]